MTQFSRDPSSPVLSVTAPTVPVVDQAPATAPHPVPRGRVGWIVAASLAVGVLAAMLLVAAPFVPVTEPAITGGVLIGFALGWTLLWLLARRFTVQERVGQQVAEALQQMLQPHGVAVYLEANHLCTQMRGVREGSPLTRTTVWRGGYELDPALRAEFFVACGLPK